METWQMIAVILTSLGGGRGIDFLIKRFRAVPTPPSVREFRNSELGQIQFRLAEVYENGITHSGTLARIEGLMRAFKGRLDDMDLVIARVLDDQRELAQDHRDLTHRVERLEEEREPR